MALSKQEQQKAFLFFAAIVALPVVFYIYLIKPAQLEISKKTSELETAKSKLENLMRIAKQRDVLEKEKLALEEQVGSVEKRLPKKQNLEDIIRIVNDEAIRQRVFISNFSPQAEISKDYFMEVPFSLSVSGSFHGLGKFLSMMGQKERIFTARNLTISTLIDAQKGYTISGNFILLAYVYK